MPGSADFVQRTVHALEAGGAAKWIVRLVVALVIIGLGCFYLLHEFRGLGASQGMDQAQIGRDDPRSRLGDTICAAARRRPAAEPREKCRTKRLDRHLQRAAAAAGRCHRAAAREGLAQDDAARHHLSRRPGDRDHVDAAFHRLGGGAVFSRAPAFRSTARAAQLRPGFDLRPDLAILALRFAADASAAVFQPHALSARARDRGAGGGATGRRLARGGRRGLRPARAVARAHDLDFSAGADFLRDSFSAASLGGDPRAGAGGGALHALAAAEFPRLRQSRRRRDFFLSSIRSG